MNVDLRAFTPADYPALAALLNTVRPDHPTNVEALREEDRARGPEQGFERWLAHGDAGLVGYGAFGRHQDSYHPKKFWLFLDVRPQHRCRGIGGRIYDHLMTRLAPKQPVSLATWARVDQTCRVRFFRNRGFQEAMREFESRLDVIACDLAPFASAEARTRARGIEVKTLAELERDPDYRRKVYALHTALDADVPMADPYTPPGFESFAERHFESPRLVKESFFVAVKGDAYVGLSELWKSTADASLHTGLTGVLPAYRRKGVALALKVAGVRFAKAQGYPEIRTWNATHNRGMLSINERLGFVKMPATIFFKKLVSEETLIER